jgi:rfaE bifunctional protein nucleotidyltransferase chain/domain
MLIDDKIKTRESLINLCQSFQSEGKTIGFTSGVFDLIHSGHVDYLQKAKAMCDVLIVGVNSDSSVRRYKGEERPIVGETQRLKVVAALESVDYVFLFDERRNNKNIELLKPDYYLKAGDYKLSELSSKNIVEQHGGKVCIIPVEEEISTSTLIEKIKKTPDVHSAQFVDREGAVHIRRRPTKQALAVFFDRDGTINEDVGYLHQPDKFHVFPNTLKGMKRIQDMGYRIIIVTNQPGIGIGYYSEEDFYRVNRAMLSTFSKAGILVDKIYFCPHCKAEGCSCRKPQQALIKRAQEELNLNIPQSYFIGDKTSDMETGKRAGMKTILVKTGFKGEDGEYPGEPDFWADDLLKAADIILGEERE